MGTYVGSAVDAIVCKAHPRFTMTFELGNLTGDRIELCKLYRLSVCFIENSNVNYSSTQTLNEIFQLHHSNTLLVICTTNIEIYKQGNLI